LGSSRTIALGAGLAYAELLDALQFGYRDENPASDTDSLDAAGFDVPAKAPNTYISEACARVRQRVQAFLNH
jgi:hypothetical protein